MIWGGKGDVFLGICIKDTWTKSKAGRMKGGKWGWLGWEKWWRDNGDNCT